MGCHFRPFSLKRHYFQLISPWDVIFDCFRLEILFSVCFALENHFRLFSAWYYFRPISPHDVIFDLFRRMMSFLTRFVLEYCFLLVSPHDIILTCFQPISRIMSFLNRFSYGVLWLNGSKIMPSAKIIQNNVLRRNI